MRASALFMVGMCTTFAAISGCAAGSSDAKDRTTPTSWPTASATAPGSKLLPIGHGSRAFVGRLIENVQFGSEAPLEYCLEDGELYLGAPHRLGTQNLAGRHDLTSKDIGLVVVAYGKERPLLDLLKPLGPCPTNYGDGQTGRFYGDRVSPEGGFRTKRNVLAKLSYIEAERAEVVKLHEVIEDGADVVVVRLFNPFEQPLKPEARGRYDGAVAGPLARSVPIAVALEPGGQLDVTLDKRVDHLVRGPYGDRTVRALLSSIELLLFSPDLRMEASLPLNIR